MAYKYNGTETEKYRNRVEALFNKGKGSISEAKRFKLLATEAEIPSDFIQRDLRDSQYIARKTREMLETVVKFVVSTTGSITDRLREDWQLVDVMQELNWNKYNKLGLTEIRIDKNGRKIKRINDWTKRNDNRHHAMDALTIAFTKRSIIQYLNNLNARVEKSIDEHVDLRNYDLSSIKPQDMTKVVMAIQKSELHQDKNGKWRFNPPMPLDEFRAEAKKHLEETLVSIKARNKVFTRNNIIEDDGSKEYMTFRGQLHDETLYGCIKQYDVKKEKVNKDFNYEKIKTVTNVAYKEALIARLKDFGGDPKLAFEGKNSLEKRPIYLDELHVLMVPSEVKTVTLKTVYTKREAITPKIKIDDIIDKKIKRLLETRLKEYSGDAMKAFSNLDENPIWFDENKTIKLKKVKIKVGYNMTPIHKKHDNKGRVIIGSDGKPIPSDYVRPNNNHHVAVYKDTSGEIHEKVVPFLEVVERANQKKPLIDKEYNKNIGWQFLFTMKQNECFVLPRYEERIGDDGKRETVKVFDPLNVDLKNPDNYSLISPNLFRVQKLSYKNYVFRHHLETKVDTNPSLKGTTWTDFRSSKGLDEIVKVRINSIGQIVQVGEY